MSRLPLVLWLVACSSSAPPAQHPAPTPAQAPAAVPAPAPVDAAVAEVAPDAAPAPPPVLATDLAIVYADKLGIVRAGSPLDAAPALITLPAKVFRPPVWSASGDLYIGLAHGDVARVDASGLHVIDQPKAAHLPWLREHDRLYRAKDGSVWISHCTKPGKRPDECSKPLYLRVDAAGDKPAAKGPRAVEPTPWPKLDPPGGYSMRTSGDGGFAHISCEHGPEGSPYKMPAGESNLPGLIGRTLWVTRAPAVIAVHVVQLGFEVVPDPPGSRGGTTNAEAYISGEYDLLLDHCDYKNSKRSRVVAAPDGLYGFLDGDHFVLARDGQPLHELPGAVDIAFRP